MKIFLPWFDELCLVAIWASPGPRTERTMRYQMPWLVGGSEALWHLWRKKWFQNREQVTTNDPTSNCQFYHFVFWALGNVPFVMNGQRQGGSAAWKKCPGGSSVSVWMEKSKSCLLFCCMPSVCVREMRNIVSGAINSAYFWLFRIYFHFCLCTQ